MWNFLRDKKEMHNKTLSQFTYQSGSQKIVEKQKIKFSTYSLSRCLLRTAIDDQW
jgi:hypothetical protein